VLLTPAVLVLVLAVVQSALWWHAAHLADAAAQRGATVAASLGAGPSDGIAAAESFVGSAGGTLASPPQLWRDAARVTVRTSVRVPHLLPGFPTSVQRTSVAMAERFIPEPDR